MKKLMLTRNLDQEEEVEVPVEVTELRVDKEASEEEEEIKKKKEALLMKVLQNNHND